MRAGNEMEFIQQSILIHGEVMGGTCPLRVFKFTSASSWRILWRSVEVESKREVILENTSVPYGKSCWFYGVFLS
jgi:hypothetical protein